MTHSWTQYSERGSRALTGLAVRLIFRFGRGFGRALMVPISLYFHTFSKGTSQYSRAYLARVLGRRPRFRERFRHYFRFSVTVMDRLFFFTNRFDRFDISVRGREHVDARVAAGTGCILLGAHVGSFEVLRAVGSLKQGIPIKALYDAHNSDMFDAILRDINSDAADQLIRMGEPGTMLRVREFVDSGGLVGVVGDRALEGGKVRSVEFLGGPAYLPVWPFRLAAAVGCPVVLFFGLFHGGNRYEIVFEPFAERFNFFDYWRAPPGMDRATADPEGAVDRPRSVDARALPGRPAGMGSSPTREGSGETGP